ncbi:heterogeneous nuclear ribonucleoprotein 1 [Tanacetum coccineum]
MGRGTWYYSLGVSSIVDAFVRSEFGVSSWHGSRVDGRSYLLSGAIDGSEANRIISDFKSYKVRVGSNGNLLWEASVFLGRKKVETLKFAAMPFGLTNAPAVFMELMSRGPWMKLFSEYGFEAKYHLGKANVVVESWSRKKSEAKNKMSKAKNASTWDVVWLGPTSVKRYGEWFILVRQGSDLHLERYVRLDNQSIECDRLDEIGLMVKFVEFVIVICEALLEAFGKLSISDQLEWVLWYATWLSDQLEWICGMLHGLVSFMRILGLREVASTTARIALEFAPEFVYVCCMDFVESKITWLCNLLHELPTHDSPRLPLSSMTIGVTFESSIFSLVTNTHASSPKDYLLQRNFNSVKCPPPPRLICEAKREGEGEDANTKTQCNLDQINRQNNEYSNVTKIFVGGLPADLTLEEFKAFFEKFGPIEDVVVMVDKETSRPRGFGFVTFNSQDTADNVLKNRFYELKNKRVEVKKAVSKEQMSGKIGDYYNIYNAMYNGSYGVYYYGMYGYGYEYGAYNSFGGLGYEGLSYYYYPYQSPNSSPSSYDYTGTYSYQSPYYYGNSPYYKNRTKIVIRDPNVKDDGDSDVSTKKKGEAECDTLRPRDSNGEGCAVMDVSEDAEGDGDSGEIGEGISLCSNGEDVDGCIKEIQALSLYSDGSSKRQSSSCTIQS